MTTSSGRNDATQSASSRRSRHAYPLINVGNALRAVKHVTEAESAYRRALDRDPENADAFYNLGLLMAGCERPDAGDPNAPPLSCVRAIGHVLRRRPRSCAVRQKSRS